MAYGELLSAKWSRTPRAAPHRGSIPAARCHTHSRLSHSGEQTAAAQGPAPTPCSFMLSVFVGTGTRDYPGDDGSSLVGEVTRLERGTVWSSAGAPACSSGELNVFVSYRPSVLCLSPSFCGSVDSLVFLGL